MDTIRQTDRSKSIVRLRDGQKNKQRQTDSQTGTNTEYDKEIDANIETQSPRARAKQGWEGESERMRHVCPCFGCAVSFTLARTVCFGGCMISFASVNRLSCCVSVRLRL